jgi:hypothetical protein
MGFIEETKYNLPVDYTKLHYSERRLVRQQYIQEQDNKCIYCKCSLDEKPPSEVTDKIINWFLFPRGFLDNPIHLQHNHDTGMTEGAVHAYCNAVLWQYEGK